MRLFALKDSLDAERAVLAVLASYEEPREYWIDLPEGADPWAVPLLLSSFAARGEWEIGPAWAGRWVRSRLVPESRQNLGEVLRENRLDAYDDLRLLELTEGRNSQDDCYLEPLRPGSAPEWFENREKGRLAEAVPLDGGRAFCAFRDGSTAVCDIASIAEADSQLVRVLDDDRVFSRMAVGAGGRCVQWGSQLRIGSEALRAQGDFLPLSWRDVARIVSGVLLETSETAEMLGCSRQNVNALVKRGALEPVKATPKSTLFLRSDIRARRN